MCNPIPLFNSYISLRAYSLLCVVLAVEDRWIFKGKLVIGESMYMSRLSDHWRHLPFPGSALHMKVCDVICQSVGVSYTSIYVHVGLSDCWCLESNCFFFQLITRALVQEISRPPLHNHSTLGDICRNISRFLLTLILCKTNAKLKALIYCRTRIWQH
jgi:hypothetical protein